MVPSIRSFRGSWSRFGGVVGSATAAIEAAVVSRLSRRLYAPPQPPIRVMDEDWDTLVLLDGCRHDLFASASTLEGPVEYRISPASATPEFLKANFAGRTHHDTVYVTANPMYRRQNLGDVFHAVVDVWADHWDDERHTVMPSHVSAATARAWERFPEKRLLVHFMQPHYPFIGELAEELGNHAGYELAVRQVTGGRETRDAPTVWERLRRGEVSRELVWAAYRENLELALPHVEDLLERLDGRTVVTSDHGNLLGERPFPFATRQYGHPPGVRCDELCKVPWLVVERSSRRRIIPQPPVEGPAEITSEETNEVAERLADLGYADA